MDWKFRELNDDESRIFFERHGDHRANVLTSEDIITCHIVGNALKTTGIEIHGAWSSPAGRALETVLCTLHGFGKMVYVHTDVRLADTAIDPESATAAKEAKARAKSRKLEGEPGLAQVLFNPRSKFAKVMTRRGKEGADCLREIAMKNPGKTTLAGSHGIARIENTIMDLRGEKLHQPNRLADRCQIVELILNSKTGKLVEENWLEPVTA